MKSRSLVLLFTLLGISSARAERLHGTLTYFHEGDSTIHPIISSKVEIWRLGPEPVYFPIATMQTDTNGTFDTTIGSGAGLPSSLFPSYYKVKVFAQNDDVLVLEQNTTPLTPAGQFAEYVFTAGLKATSPSADLEFTHQFGSFASLHFWANGVLRIPKAFADSHRDPNESDTIGRVTVAPVNLTGPATTFYDPNDAHDSSGERLQLFRLDYSA